MNKLTIIGIILFLFLVYSLAIYHLGKSNAKKEIVTHTDTLTVYIDKVDTLLKPIFITRTKKDTIRTTDSIYIKESTQYIARKDTSYRDSLLTLAVEYVSPIPLSRDSYFNLFWKVKERTIRETKIIETYSGARYFIQLGMRMNLTDEIKPIYEAGAGLYMVNNSFLEIPISLNAEYLEKLSWNTQAQIRLKF